MIAAKSNPLEPAVDPDVRNVQSTRRTDEQLTAMLNETRDWIVNGQQGQPLCISANLQMAVDQAGIFAQSGAIVAAISCLAPVQILIFPGQIERLARHQATRGPPCDAFHPALNSLLN